jgi:HicB family
VARRYPLQEVSPVEESVRDKGDDKGHSGRLLLRMPRTLHAELAQLAEKRGVSLNQLIVGLLSGSVENGSNVRGSTDGLGADAEAQRRLGLALTVNLIVLVIVASVAIALLIVALRGGF